MQSSSNDADNIIQQQICWSQTKNKNTKTCFLEDLEEINATAKEVLNHKTRLEKKNCKVEANVKQNNATMTENTSITRSTFSASTPNIFSLSTLNSSKRDLRSFRNGDQILGNVIRIHKYFIFPQDIMTAIRV